MILDAGALIAIDRNDRATVARVLAADEDEDELKAHPMVVAQVWRDGRRQANLSRFLLGVRIVEIDDELGRRCGELLGKAHTADPIDAAVVLISNVGEAILTSDPEDLRHLATVARRKLLIVRC